LKLGEPKYPAPQYGRFEFSPDTELAVHEGTIYVTTEAEAESSLAQGARSIRAKLTVQSCNHSQCLAPSDIAIEIPLQAVAVSAQTKDANAEIFSKAEAQPAATATGGSTALKEFKGSGKGDDIGSLIASQGIVWALITIFFLGLTLNLTPCVFPIIPITVGFFANAGSKDGSPRLRRTFLMASLYVIGMAITYSVLGVVASLTKGLFGAALQNPIVLVGIATVMVGLSLSMFGVYEFKLPEFLNRFATESTQSTSGFVGAFVMGLTMGIVAAPCIGPVVLGLLIHVGAKGDPVYGFSLFFVMALGLGAPYLILGTFSGAIKSLPRSGVWMVTVRKVFGLVLIGMALYFLMPLMGDWEKYVMMAFFAISAIYLIFWESRKARPVAFAWILRAIGVGAAAAVIWLALPPKTGIEWQPYSESALAQARAEGRGVMIDVFADWCVPCKELDHITFTDSDVKQEAARFVRLKLDLTKDDPQSEAGRAKERFNILGVPTVIFIDGAGSEVSDVRLEQFEEAAPFLSRMKKVTFTAKEGESASGKSVAVAGAEDYEPAPAMSLNLIDGSKLDLASLRGKAVLVDFWATWCVPCVSEIPMFNELIKQYKDQGLEIIAISLDEQGAEIVKPFLKRYPMNYTQVIGDKSVAAEFSVEDSSLPVAFLIDKQGRIRFKHVGVTKKEAFESEIKQLLAE
jgi:thiol:disulfide interchange protein DsbD